MTPDPEKSQPEPEHADHEGLFDAQLSLPLPFVEAPEAISTVRKRNGREEPFSRAKIANAIFQAAKSIGGTDQGLADSLARAVTIYLTKRLGVHAPTVDHIHDAVERVLIQMEHIRTAFAYARYRDRRARIRRLREGDLRHLLSELEEARGGLGAPDQRSLFIRTSDDTIISWNREKIVEALVRETGLEEPMAVLIATEVEEQLASARIETLTTSLVRELVAARLVAHDLGAYRERHRRLGVPLYDCERIIRGLTEATTGKDPVATGLVLAGAVKKEFALTQIHAPHISEAHLDGSIHLHDLECPDRLHSATLSPAMVAQFGVGLPGAPDFASPPRNATTFLAQLAKATASMQACVARPIKWDAVNYHFAGYVRQFSDAERTQFAQMMVYEFAYRALEHGGDGQGTELRLYWAPPAHLAALKVAGPEDVVPDCTYGELEHAAQQLAWKFIEVLLESEGLPVVAPIIGVCLEPGFAKAPGSEAFLNAVASLVDAGFQVRFYFDRGALVPPITAPWQALQGVYHNVVLNLPRMAYQTGKEATFMEALDRQVGVAAAALAERFLFLDGLLDRGTSGPLGLLNVSRSQSGVFSIGGMHGCVAVLGLDEAVKAITGARLHEHKEARDVGGRIVRRLCDKLAQESRNRDMFMKAAGETDQHIAARFAESDLRNYPVTAENFILTDEYSYSSGLSLSYDRSLSPFEALEYEGAFHESLDSEYLAPVSMPDTGLAGESIARFLSKLHNNTSVNGIFFQ